MYISLYIIRRCTFCHGINILLKLLCGSDYLFHPMGWAPQHQLEPCYSQAVKYTELVFSVCVSYLVTMSVCIDNNLLESEIEAA